MTDEEYMRLALLEAESAYDLDEIPIGAVIVDENGRVISKEHNLKEGRKTPILHAEIVALLNLHTQTRRMYLNGCTMYVTLEPCPMCAAALVMERISRIVFAAEDLRYGACGSVYNLVEDRRLNHKIEVTRGVSRDEAEGLMKRFFSKLRED